MFKREGCKHRVGAQGWCVSVAFRLSKCPKDVKIAKITLKAVKFVRQKLPVENMVTLRMGCFDLMDPFQCLRNDYKRDKRPFYCLKLFNNVAKSPHSCSFARPGDSIYLKSLSLGGT